MEDNDWKQKYLEEKKEKERAYTKAGCLGLILFFILGVIFMKILFSLKWI